MGALPIRMVSPFHPADLMSTFRIPASLILLAALLSGCAATVQRPPTTAVVAGLNIPAASAKRVVLNVQLAPSHPQDAGWEAFKKEWVDIMREQAQGQAMQFAAQSGEPKATGETGTLMVVRVADYRHVGVGARLAFGIMTGNAFIDAKIEFRDLQSGDLIGERRYNTTSSAVHGVFAAVTPKQIYAIADEALAEINKR